MTKLVVEVEGDVEEPEVVKEVVKEVPVKQTKTPFKKIADLNDEEKKKIIDSIKAGKESEHYELKIHKNGREQIVKKKPQSFVEKVVTNTKTKEKTDPDKIFLTNDQLMNQRLSDLEVKYTKLETKYKKQKKRVNDIYENIEEDVVISPPEVHARTENVETPNSANQESPPPQPRATSLRALRLKRY